MPLELLTVKDLEKFKTELLEEIKNLLLKKAFSENKLLKTKDVCRMLKLKPGTLQNLRNKKKLDYRKIGGTIYYKQEHVEELIR